MVNRFIHNYMHKFGVHILKMLKSLTSYTTKMVPYFGLIP